MTANPYASTARLYRACGWRGTLPIPYGRKAPPPPGWTGRAGPLPSEADVAAWLELKGPRNIAIRLPEDVIGLDVDGYDGRPGLETLAELEGKHGQLPATWRSTARPGGQSGIRYYRLPEAITSDDWPNEAGPGIDIIRHTHRYAMVWPSLHPNGGTYVWLRPDDDICLDDDADRIPPIDMLPELPAAWVSHMELLVTRLQGATNGGLPHDDVFAGERRFTQDEAQEFVSRALETLRSAPVGQINQALNDAAKMLSHFGDEFWAAGRAHGWLREALRCTEYDGQTWKASDTIASAYRSADNDWKAVLAPERAVEASEDHDAYEVSILRKLSELRVADEARRRLKIERGDTVQPPSVLTLKEALQVARPELKYRIDGLQPMGSRVILAAQAKAGKTTLVTNLVRCLADGGELFGRFAVPKQGGTVAMLDFEMSQFKLCDWLSDQDIVNKDRVILIPMRGRAASFDILDPRTRAKWAAILREHEVSYAVVDCLRPILDAIGLDEHKDAGRFLVALDALLEEAKIPDAMLVHHMGHNGDRSRGDSRIRDWPDAEWTLRRSARGTRSFSAYGRDVDQVENDLWYDSMTRHLTLVDVDTKTQRRLESALEVVQNMAPLEGPISAMDLYLLIGADGHTQTAAMSMVKDAREMGFVQVKRDGTRALHELTEEGRDRIV